jgi:hypothetical protein
LPDFKEDEVYLLTYRVAETLGWSAERVQEELSAEELQGWGVYLNSIFGSSVQDDLRMGWLVWNIRCMLRGKGSAPNITDALPPTQKMMREFFKDNPAPDPVGQKVMFGRMLEESKVIKKERDRLWQEGKIMRHGLYINEVCDKPVGPDVDWADMGDMVKDYTWQ